MDHRPVQRPQSRWGGGLNLADEHVKLAAAVLCHAGAEGPRQGEGPQHADVQHVILRVGHLQPILRRGEGVEEERQRPHRVDFRRGEELRALLGRRGGLENQGCESHGSIEKMGSTNGGVLEAPQLCSIYGPTKDEPKRQTNEMQAC